MVAMNSFVIQQNSAVARTFRNEECCNMAIKPILLQVPNIDSNLDLRVDLGKQKMGDRKRPKPDRQQPDKGRNGHIRMDNGQVRMNNCQIRVDRSINGKTSAKKGQTCQITPPH